MSGTIGMMAYWFINFTLINRILEGQMIASADMAVLNSVVAFRPFSLFGIINFSVPNFEMLTSGIPRLMKFDYSFFGGYGGYAAYMLYSISFGVAFMLFVLIIGSLVSNYLNRSR